MAPSRTQLETGTTVNAGPVFAITILADAVFTTLTGLTGSSLTAVSFPAGITIYGNFTTITLTSGSILLYYY